MEAIKEIQEAENEDDGYSVNRDLMRQDSVFDHLVDLSLNVARIGLNYARTTPTYRHPFSGQSIYSSVDTLTKAQAEAWAAWGVNVGQLKGRRRRAPIGAYSRIIYENMDQTELVLRAQIDAFKQWNINASHIERQLADRVRKLEMNYGDRVSDYFHRMATPSPIPADKKTNSCLNLSTDTDSFVTFPMRNAFSLPAGLDLPLSSSE